MFSAGMATPPCRRSFFWTEGSQHPCPRTKAIRFGERAKLELIAQFFDLTNRANYGNNYSGNIRSSQFQKVQGYITPSGVTIPHSFSAELGAQFRF